MARRVVRLALAVPNRHPDHSPKSGHDPASQARSLLYAVLSRGVLVLELSQERYRRSAARTSKGSPSGGFDAVPAIVVAHVKSGENLGDPHMALKGYANLVIRTVRERLVTRACGRCSGNQRYHESAESSRRVDMLQKIGNQCGGERRWNWPRACRCPTITCIRWWPSGRS